MPTYEYVWVLFEQKLQYSFTSAVFLEIAMGVESEVGSRVGMKLPYNSS
jgi:hypothetical protein